MSFFYKNLLTISLIWLCTFTHAQVPLLPPDSAIGIPGSVTNSFVIVWSSADGAIAYEYVLTDNQQCTQGCAGDTRQNIVTDTFAVELDLKENVDYYWIIRAVYADSTVGFYSAINSFVADYPGPGVEIIKVLGNPISSRLKMEVDWQVLPNVSSIFVNVYDLVGKIVMPTSVLTKAGENIRFEKFNVDLEPVLSGVYLVILSSDDNASFRRTYKVVVF
ncbi:MAG: hypothetical protein IIA45_09345 [Bacteroidetes bacterium]|nr:hypothetical protein [Bacteroidota bacterium]